MLNYIKSSNISNIDLIFNFSKCHSKKEQTGRFSCLDGQKTQFVQKA